MTIITGTPGADTLSGSAGPDVFTGGAGRDLFVIATGQSGVDRATADVIVDWTYEDTVSIGGITATDMLWGAASNYAGAVAVANTNIASGAYNVVAFSLGLETAVFVDSANDNGAFDDVVIISGIDSSELSAANFATTPAATPPPPHWWPPVPVTAAPPASALPGLTAALLAPDARWGGTSVTFSIPQAGSAWPGYASGSEPFSADYATLSAPQADAFRTAVGSWGGLIAMPLRETDDITQPGDIRIAYTGIPLGYASHPPYDGNSPTARNGDIWLDRLSRTSDYWAPGPEGAPPITYRIMVHETGHALGLKHPHDGGSLLPVEFDTQRYSVMSYKSAIDNIVYKFYGDPTSSAGWDRSISIIQVTKPMVYDILALQSLYGANPHTNAGNTTYTWDQSKAFFDSIYDAGGIDTFDLSAHSRGSEIDLTPGAYSSVAKFTLAQQQAYWLSVAPASAATGIVRSFSDVSMQHYGYTWTANVGVAFSTTIENVLAGSGDDTISGNASGNSLAGNAGSDRIFGGAGDDTLSGGAGANYLRGDDGNDSISGGGAFDNINGNMGDDTASGGAGDDWVVGGKDQDRLFGDAGSDIVLGNLGNDTCDGGDGADVVRGGQSDDVVTGGAGDDYLSGDRGNDTLAGGTGADRFHGSQDAGIDRVTDFKLAEGDRVMLDPGTTYTLAQMGADTVIDMGGGHQMILAGVQLTSLGAGWLIQSW